MGYSNLPPHSFAEALAIATSDDEPLAIIYRMLATFPLILSHTRDLNVQNSNG